MNAEIRTYQSTDRNEVLSLAAEVLCRELGVRKSLDGEDDLQDVSAAYPPPDNVFLVAERDGKVVATGAIARLTDHDCEVRRLWVHPEHRRLGIGSSLAAGLLDFVRKRGYRRILLERLPEMQYTQETYSRYGFAPVPASDDLPRAGEFLAIRL